MSYVRFILIYFNHFFHLKCVFGALFVRSIVRRPNVRGPSVRGPNVRRPNVRRPNVRGPSISELFQAWKKFYFGKNFSLFYNDLRQSPLSLDMNVELLSEEKTVFYAGDG